MLTLNDAGLERLPPLSDRQIVQLSHVLGVDLSGNALRRIPGWLILLPNLVRLNVSNNPLSALPAELAGSPVYTVDARDTPLRRRDLPPCLISMADEGRLLLPPDDDKDLPQPLRAPGWYRRHGPTDETHSYWTGAEWEDDAGEGPPAGAGADRPSGVVRAKRTPPAKDRSVVGPDRIDVRCPDVLTVGGRERVIVRMIRTPALDELLLDGVPRRVHRDIEPLAVWYRTDIRLTSASGVNVRPLSESEQVVSPTVVSEWIFELTGRDAGQHDLTLSVSSIFVASSDLDGSRRVLPPVSLPVTVEAKARRAGRAFLSANWRWLAGTSAVASTTAAGLVIR